MNSVFISYRHVKPDEEMAHVLETCLRERGCSVFIDSEIMIGAKWANEIESRLKASDFFIVLLSAESILSDMVRQEVKLAHELSRIPERRFTILPIRVGFTGELPYDIGAYLDPIQYALWLKDDTFESITRDVIAAIEHSIELPNAGKTELEKSSPSGITELTRVTEAIGAPLPASDHRLETGSIKLDSPFYVLRSADAQLQGQTYGEGTTTVIKGTRQMGKSSLLARAYAKTRAHQKALYLDLQLIDREQLENLETLLKYLANRFAKQFKATIKPSEFWDTSLGSKENLTEYFEEAILAESRVVILFDEVDLIFDLPYRDQFFALIRVWHNLRATRQIWNNLNIVIAHSTEPYLWIQDINQSPFNVGQRISLDDFDLEQIGELNRKYGGVLRAESEVSALKTLLAGHPFLIRQALFTLANRHLSLSQLQKEATEETGPFGDHLRRYAWSLANNPRLKVVLQAVLRRNMCEEEEDFQRLKAAGLIKGETRHSVQMRCQLYENYFSRHL